MSCGSMPPRAASLSGRAKPCARVASACAKSIGSATARSRPRSNDHPEIFIKVRSTRAPQPAWLRAGSGGGIEVELIAGEDSVSPGQACVFYDAADGQARVLGGGVIDGTIAAATVQRAADMAAVR